MDANIRYSFSIKKKVLLGFSILAFIIFVSVVCTLIAVKYSSEGASNTINHQLPAYDIVNDLSIKLYESQTVLQSYIISKDKGILDRFNSIWSKINDDVNLIDENNVNKLVAIKSQIKEYYMSQESLILNLNNSKNIDENIRVTLKNLNNLSNILIGTVGNDGIRSGGFYDTILNELNVGANSILTHLTFIQWIEYFLLGIIIIVSLVIGTITANSITKPLGSAVDIAKRISSGERNIPIVENSIDETGTLLKSLKLMQISINENEQKIISSEANAKNLYEQLLKAANTFSLHSSRVAEGDLRQRIDHIEDNIMSKLGHDLNKMTESLSQITKQTMEASISMVKTLDEVQQAVNVQSSGASEQATSINQITASLEEIEKSSTQTMEKAKTLGVTAERTRDQGQQGMNAVEQSIEGMRLVKDKVQLIANTILELSQQTQQIGEITAVVNTLAQQSKMLALNASIEAAKAGEAGKGFAVVAAEVKSLAEQSELSTSQVQKILEDIRHATEKAVMVTEEGVKGVDHGTELVEQTGDIVKKLTEVIQEASISTQQIEAAVRQESIGIEQIAAGMNEINQVTTSFVASTRQTTEAIGGLSNIAKNIKESVDTYKV